MSSGQFRKQWHKYLPLAILNYNTKYHTSFECEPSRILQGQLPCNTLNNKHGTKLKTGSIPTIRFPVLPSKISFMFANVLKLRWGFQLDPILPKGFQLFAKENQLVSFQFHFNYKFISKS